MIVLETGRVGMFVMVLGGERARDLAWTIHQSTPEAQRGEFFAWGDDDVGFRVVNDGVVIDGLKFSFIVHGSPHTEWGTPALADVVIATAEIETGDTPVVSADQCEGPFEAWKNALKVGLARIRGTEKVRATSISPDDPVSKMLEIGAVAIEGQPLHLDPLDSLTRRSPGCRVGYCASYLDHEVRNGGFAQLMWNVVAAERRSLVGGAVDALHTLGLDEAASQVDEALIRTSGQMDLLERLVPLGREGFAQFRDRAGLAELDALYWQHSRGLRERLAQFTRDWPEYFVLD